MVHYLRFLSPSVGCLSYKSDGPRHTATERKWERVPTAKEVGVENAVEENDRHPKRQGGNRGDYTMIRTPESTVLAEFLGAYRTLVHQVHSFALPFIRI